MAQVAFSGNVGKVRGVQFSQDGKARFGFSVAEGHSRYDKQANEWKDTGTTWRNVTVFGKRAEALAEVIQEGAKQQVVVIGREETRDWQKDDGSTGQSFDVVADVVGVIPKSQQSQGGGFQQPAQQSAPPQQQGGGWNAPAADPWSAGSQQQNNGGWGNPSDSPAF